MRIGICGSAETSEELSLVHVAVFFSQIYIIPDRTHLPDDTKVSAVIDGEIVFSEEMVWNPKINSNPAYHFEGIVSALKTTASKMPQVDAIGISLADICIVNRTIVASLFLAVSNVSVKCGTHRQSEKDVTESS